MITIDEIKEKYRAGTCHQVCDIKTCGERIEIANLAVQLDEENKRLREALEGIVEYYSSAFTKEHLICWKKESPNNVYEMAKQALNKIKE